MTEKGETTTSVSYSIYSRGGMSAEEYGKNKRSHWGIENSLHWVLDIGVREDESRMRAGNAAENVNVLRHIGTNLLKQEKSCRFGIASKRKNAVMTRNICIKFSERVEYRYEINAAAMVINESFLQSLVTFHIHAI